MNPPNNPVVNAGLLYVNGLQIDYATATTINLISGAARDSTNTNDIILKQNTILNSAIIGPNGMASAPLVANAFYAVYIIGDSTDYNATAGLLSQYTLPAKDPVLPHGYDMFRRVGWIKTDGSANILPFAQNGINEVRNYYYLTPINILTNGTSTTYALLSASSAVPPISNFLQPEIVINVNYTPSSAGNSVLFAISNTIGTGPIAQFGCGVAAPQFGTIRIIGNTVFDFSFYKVSAGDTVTLNVVGYTDYL